MSAVSAAPGSPGASRYCLGIDLGTTHCALSWVDTQASEGDSVVQGVLQLPQLVGPGQVDVRPLLPSFVYLPHDSELAPGDLGLPWAADQAYAVGEMARQRGAATPGRLVASAKSWLCHPGVDRRAPILPAEAPPEVARVSPLEVSVRYLAHLRAAWNQQHPEAPSMRRTSPSPSPPPSTPPPASSRPRPPVWPATSSSRCSRSRKPRSTAGSSAARASGARP